MMSTKSAKSDGLMHLKVYLILYSFRVSCVHVLGAVNDATGALSRTI